MQSDHFEGKSVSEHLKETFAKGAFASAETHGMERCGHLIAGADVARDTAVLLFLVWILFPHQIWLFFIFSAALLVWKMGRSALLGWSRLERLHRTIEEERWEIEHHRDQEKEELIALYNAKGFSGKLLEEVVTTLMADDNRILRVMLEEEMGLTVEAYEHPLKQSLGAAIGVFTSSSLFVLSYVIDPVRGPFFAISLSIILAVLILTKVEKNRLLEAIIWNLSITAFTGGVAFFLKMIP